MARIHDLNGTAYELIASHQQREDQIALSFRDEHDAFALLRNFTQDDAAFAEIRRFASENGLLVSARTHNDATLLRLIAALLVSRQLRIVRPGKQPSIVTSGGTPRPKKSETTPPPEPAPPPPVVEKTWIKFEIVDEATGKPVPGVSLKVKLPDGESRTVTSDGGGMIEITGIPAGTCDIERMIDNDALEVVSIQ